MANLAGRHNMLTIIPFARDVQLLLQRVSDGAMVELREIVLMVIGVAGALRGSVVLLRALRSGRMQTRGRHRDVIRARNPRMFWSNVSLLGFFVLGSLMLAIWMFALWLQQPGSPL